MRADALRSREGVKLEERSALLARYDDRSLQQSVCRLGIALPRALLRIKPQQWRQQLLGAGNFGQRQPGVD